VALDILAITDAIVTPLLVRNVDIFGEGAHGELSAQSGYINQDGRLLRIIDITLPLVINDVWPQTP
jgi:hypothetical protein